MNEPRFEMLDDPPRIRIRTPDGPLDIPVKDPDPDEPATVLCMPTSLGPSAVPSVVKECARCGTEVWASYGTIASMAQVKEVTYICVPCMVSEEKKGA